MSIRTTDLFGLYARMSGTSLAAPHVAGALALLLSAFPGLPPDRQAAALESRSSRPRRGGPGQHYGYGRLDALAAYDWLLGTAGPDFSVTATPALGDHAGGRVGIVLGLGRRRERLLRRRLAGALRPVQLAGGLDLRSAGRFRGLRQLGALDHDCVDSGSPGRIRSTSPRQPERRHITPW